MKQCYRYEHLQKTFQIEFTSPLMSRTTHLISASVETSLNWETENFKAGLWFPLHEIRPSTFIFCPRNTWYWFWDRNTDPTVRRHMQRTIFASLKGGSVPLHSVFFCTIHKIITGSYILSTWLLSANCYTMSIQFFFS